MTTAAEAMQERLNMLMVLGSVMAKWFLASSNLPR
jgi:hypothetical protein